MKKKIILSLICLLTLCGCGKIPKLQNGEEAVITFAKGDVKHQISAEELYKELKDNFGLEATLKVIDTYILETEFADYKDEAQKSAENMIDAMAESYEGKDKLLDAIRENTNYTTIEGYQDYLYTSYMQSHALEEYAKSLVTDKDIEEYYNDEAKGDVEVYHILVVPKVTDDMTKEEQEQAESDAKKKVEDMIEELNKADNKLEKFKELAKANSDDTATKDKDGNLGYINYGDLSSSYDELLDAVYKLKDGDYSKNVITTELGYHIAYRNQSKEKESLDKLKDEIKETLANRKLQNEENIAVESMKYYRKLYNLEIVDSELDRQYGIYINNITNSSSSN